MNIFEGRIKTQSGNIAYLDSMTKGEVLICLHGNTSCKEVFNHQFSGLSGKYRIIAPDLPGFGSSFRSRIPEKEYQLSHMSNTIKDFCSKLQIKQAFFFGWSLGGHIAIELINTSSLVEKLITLGTPPLPLKSPSQAFNIPDDFPEFIDKDHYTKDEAKIFISGSCCKAMSEDEYSLNAAMVADGKARLTAIKSLISGKYDQYKTIKETNIPVMIMIGENDPVISDSYKALIKKDFKNQFQPFIGKLHDGFFEYPGKFNCILDKFLSLK